MRRLVGVAGVLALVMLAASALAVGLLVLRIDHVLVSYKYALIPNPFGPELAVTYSRAITTPTPLPLATATAAPIAPPPATQAPAPAADESVAIVAGACPAGYRVKANPDSMIYHVPGGGSYSNTRNNRVRCYATTAAAAAAGYRRANN